jgi:hypothetical protein
MLITEQNQDLLMDISGMFLPDLSHTDDTFGYDIDCVVVHSAFKLVLFHDFL